MRHVYPLLLDVTDRRVLIVGGGAVAARKAKGLLDAGAGRVKVVSPRFCVEMPEAVERLTATYSIEQLDGIGLVFAATDSAEVNDAVVAACRARGILVSRADSDEERPGDFVTPARFVEGDVVVTVSAGGNPALSVLIRDGLKNAFDARWVKMAEAMEVLRPRVLASGWDIARRRDALRALATESALAVLESKGVDGLWDWVRADHAGDAGPERMADE